MSVALQHKLAVHPRDGLLLLPVFDVNGGTHVRGGDFGT